MNAKDIIQENNDKREQLNTHNTGDYEDMLAYIRLNSNKSEQQTEEILLELLDHLLIGQKEGKTAQDVFGNELKAYCDEIIGEIPKEDKKTATLFFVYIGLIFIASALLAHSILGYVFNFFNVGETELSFSLGNVAILIPISAVTLYVMFKFIFKMISDSLFKKDKTSTIKMFIYSFFIGALIGTPLVLTFVFLPSIGMEITLPLYVTLVSGLVVYLVTIVLNKKYRITK